MINPGSSRFDCELIIDPSWQIPGLNYREPSGIIWHRLRYKILTDPSGFLVAGSNRMEVRQPEGSTVSSAQVVSTYYKRWDRSASDVGTKLKENSLLRLRVEFDKREARAIVPPVKFTVR